jgi:Protein of unknown function (DUF4065)
MTTAASLSFEFDELRATQAAALLLKLSGNRDNCTRVIKLLYIADRKSLAEAGAPISGGKFCNMTNGPLASEVYSCVKGDLTSIGGTWKQYIRRDGQYDIELIPGSDPGDSELSDYDVETLTAIATEHRGKDYGKLIDLVHEFSEWVDPGTSSAPLPACTILKAAAGVPDDQICDLVGRQEAVKDFKAKLAV